jgi:hypothetical protein
MEKVENYIEEEVQPKTVSSPIKKGPYNNGSHFEKNEHLKVQLHMAYDISTRFHKV